jgi:outer membrane protein
MRITTIIFVLISSIGFSQDKWDLESCINYALTHNIQIKQQELNTKVQENQLTQSKISLLPSLNGSLSRNFSYGRSVDPYTNDFTEEKTTNDSYGINSSVTLFNGFQKINTVKKNQLDLKANIKDLEKLRNDISLNVASAYLNVLFSMELLETSLDQIDITKQQEHRTQKLVDAGSLALGDLLEIRAQKANEELQAVNYDNQLEIALLNLKQLLELDTLNDFTIVRPNVQVDQVDLPLNFDEVFDYAMNNLPQVMSAQFRLEASQKSLSIAKGARSPQLTLGAGINTGYSDARKEIDNSTFTTSYQANGGYATDASGNQLPTYILQPNYSYKTKSFNDQFNDNLSSYAVLTLNVPIFNAWQVNTNISNSKINVLNAQYSLDLEKKNLYKEIQQKFLDAVAAKKKFDATESSLTSTQELFNYTQKKFDVGLVNTLDYNLSKNRVTKSQSDLLQAKYEYIFAVKILDFYQGKVLSL